ncbi:MAG: hypothetical protein ACLFQM_13500 [Fidelibacterota bacterium]
MAHQCQFVSIWGFPRRLNGFGFRASASQASLNSVLDPDGYCRTRVPLDSTEKIRPFAWVPNPEINVIVTHQFGPESQKYLPAEQAAVVKFVQEGGGIIIMGSTPKTKEDARRWTLNHLLKKFGAEFTATNEKYMDLNFPVLNCSDDWKVTATGETGKPVKARRQFGKGYVVILGEKEAIIPRGHHSKEEKAEKDKIFKDAVLWAAQGKDPINNEFNFYSMSGGGGAIYPELEKQLGRIVVYYTKNQTEELIQTVEEELPSVTEKIFGWLPSPEPEEPMYIILSSGGGGGWAVNAFKPRENGLISLDPFGVISIFAHELAHTLAGPDNAKGEWAGIAPHHDRGEAHAGWFQGKINAIYNPEFLKQSNRNCNAYFENEEWLDLDFKKHYETKEGREKFGKGKDWTKMWWIWNKLDDKYGPTWYPRWRWVQHTRWMDTPDHKLTWEEMVADMSIAVGEDLFPFFIETGTSLNHNRLESIEFQGKMIDLPVADIDLTPAGNVSVETIGDYKQPL